MSKNNKKPAQLNNKLKNNNHYNTINITKEDKSNINNQFNYTEESSELNPHKIYNNQDLPRPGRIIHQSTQHSFDDRGNRVVTTKTVREIESVIDINNQDLVGTKRYPGNKIPQRTKNVQNKRLSKYNNIKNETEKQKALFSSPDFQDGISPSNSPPIFISNDSNNYGYNYYSNNNRERYRYINDNINNSREINPNVEIISPVGYKENDSSGSDNEENQMRSFDNYNIQERYYNNNNIIIKKNKNGNLNYGTPFDYELEEPEGFDYLKFNVQRNNNDTKDINQIQNLNKSEYRRKIVDMLDHSDRHDFQSPDRDLNQENKFRKVSLGMLHSKGPTNNDKKVTTIITRKVANTKKTKIKMYKNRKPHKDKIKTNISKIRAAKIIQAWWRNKRKIKGQEEEEVYDITVKKAIKIQALIRGFLVRKKVLRYITLAIYYQSFCDKLQDVLCNNVKKEVFNYFIKEYFPNRQSVNISNNIKVTNINKNQSINITQKNLPPKTTKNTNVHQNLTSKASSSRINTTRSNNYPSAIDLQSPITYHSPSYTQNTQLIINDRSSKISDEKADVTIYHISPDYYNYNRKNILEKKEIIETNRYNNYSKNKIEEIKEKNSERNISPTFGILNENKTITIPTKDSNTNLNTRNKRRKKVNKVNSQQNFVDITTTKRKIKKITSTTNNSTKKPVIKRVKNVKIIRKSSDATGIPKQKNEIISGGTLSIVKLPNRRINTSESEDVYTHIKKKKIEKYIERYKANNTENIQPNYKQQQNQANTIDNQLSINIMRLSGHDKEKEEIMNTKNKTIKEEFIKFIDLPIDVIKEKEKKPETAEGGNDTQVFDMAVCERVAMSIEASSETKDIIKNELKEIEIYKKREIEKNKEIKKYKKDFELQKLKNKYDKLKTAIRIIEYWRNRFLNKKFKQFKNNCFSGLNNQITYKYKEKKEKIIIKKEIKNFDTLEISKNRSISYEQEPKKNKDEKHKNIEIQIRTVKRSLAKMEIPLLKKIWIRKAFRTFRENCKRPEYHKIIGREILRMALLKWRFIKGYGPDRYGNVYDRNGKLLYKMKSKAKVADMEVQNDFIAKKKDQSTQYIPIENVITKLRQIEISSAYKKKKEPEKIEHGVGDDIKLNEFIKKGETITVNYKGTKKEKQENKIIRNEKFQIKKNIKNIKSTGTQMPQNQNKIIKLEKINISSDKFKQKNQRTMKIKELLTKMIYKKMVGDKLALSGSLRHWLNQTLLILQMEQFDVERKKRRLTSISKIDRFAFVEEIKKIETGTQIEKNIQKIEKIPILNIIRIKPNKETKNIPAKFDAEKMKQQNENIISYKSVKKPVKLEPKKENDIQILGNDYYIFGKNGIRYKMIMTEEDRNTRIKEILVKYLDINGDRDGVSNLKKYFTIWRRKANYLSCFENAKIITQFCRKYLNKNINYKKWKKICEKLILKERIKIIKLIKEEKINKNKIFDLIRVTRINSVLAKRKYLHYILLCWLAYTRNINRKRKHVKVLYENMLNTYMHMADDVFGNDQKENPSVQDALFEAMESDKFHTKNRDVPNAEKFYQNKKEPQKIIYINNNTNNQQDNTEPNNYITYQKIISMKRPLKTSTSSERITKRKIIKVGENERLQSRGRGRKYRTKVEKEILTKFYDDKNSYIKLKKEEEKEIENEGNENIIDINDDEFKEIKSINLKSNQVRNKLGNSYNFNYNSIKDDKERIPYNKRTFVNRSEIIYRKKKDLTGGIIFNKKEDEKEKEEKDY